MSISRLFVLVAVGAALALTVGAPPASSGPGGRDGVVFVVKTPDGGDETYAAVRDAIAGSHAIAVVRKREVSLDPVAILSFEVVAHRPLALVVKKVIESKLATGETVEVLGPTVLSAADLDDDAGLVGPDVLAPQGDLPGPDGYTVTLDASVPGAYDPASETGTATLGTLTGDAEDDVYTDGDENRTLYPSVHTHVALRIQNDEEADGTNVWSSGSIAIVLAAGRRVLVKHDGPIEIAPGEEARFWVTDDGQLLPADAGISYEKAILLGPPPSVKAYRIAFDFSVDQNDFPNDLTGTTELFLFPRGTPGGRRPGRIDFTNASESSSSGQLCDPIRGGECSFQFNLDWYYSGVVIQNVYRKVTDSQGRVSFELIGDGAFTAGVHADRQVTQSNLELGYGPLLAPVYSGMNSLVQSAATGEVHLGWFD